MGSAGVLAAAGLLLLSVAGGLLVAGVNRPGFACMAGAGVLFILARIVDESRRG